MFYGYRSATVRALECPEVGDEKNFQKRADPSRTVDVYSFGMLMWEVLHEKEPFEGEVQSAKEYVVQEDARPLIRTVENTIQDDEEDKVCNETVSIPVCLTTGESVGVILL